MRQLILLSLFALIALSPLSAQIKDVSKWKLRAEKVDAVTYDLIADVTIDPGWYIYSRHLAPDEGPIPTSFAFKDGIKVISEREGGNKHEEFDAIFEMHLVKFSQQATFITRVRLPAGAKNIQGSYTFMSCDDTRCLPPIEQMFTVALP
jgi:hypothetical protein